MRERGDVVVKVRVRVRGRCCSEGERWEGDVVVKVRVRGGGGCGGEE